MDFDLNFGRFFGLEIDSFTEAGSSETVPPKEILNSKKTWFSLGKTLVFTKLTIFALQWKSMKNVKKQEKNGYETTFFLTSILE